MKLSGMQQVGMRQRVGCQCCGCWEQHVTPGFWHLPKLLPAGQDLAIIEPVAAHSAVQRHSVDRVRYKCVAHLR